MQTTVIMYTDAIEKAARESCEQDPGDDAMPQIPAYLDALEAKIKKQGYGVARRNEALSPGPCFGARCDCADGYDAIRHEDAALDYCCDLPSYWEWL